MHTNSIEKQSKTDQHMIKLSKHNRKLCSAAQLLKNDKKMKKQGKKITGGV